MGLFSKKYTIENIWGSYLESMDNYIDSHPDYPPLPTPSMPGHLYMSELDEKHYEEVWHRGHVVALLAYERACKRYEETLNPKPTKSLFRRPIK